MRKQLDWGQLRQFDWPNGDTSCNGKQISVHTRELAPETDSCNRFSREACYFISNQFDMKELAQFTFDHEPLHFKSYNCNIPTSFLGNRSLLALSSFKLSSKISREDKCFYRVVRTVPLAAVVIVVHS